MHLRAPPRNHRACRTLQCANAFPLCVCTSLQPDQYEDLDGDPDDSVVLGVGPCPQAEVDVQQVLCGVDQGLVAEVVLCFDRPEDMCISQTIG